ncbi:Predicted ATPase [Rubritalea squalenifaciens DSM 18772]|uniref:Predicted ATPase n=1 Tax=Rubritalea squalenifaciens DSM 18772 TaxID=1123071 RepID=A0A1M6D981_9BACT|nr:AAA family ATPase [Rubritalea squalenifaciens]SHI69785.1 Predicted ATPase [Rubritalea squalenifaciens DSM 18772]
MLERFLITGYRSLLDIDLKLDQVSVITGENGVGKSNCYRALKLVSAIAEGNFAQAIADEGGMPSALWAGPTKAKSPQQITIEITHSDFIYQLVTGLVPSSPEDPTFFALDPDIKTEKLYMRKSGTKRLVASRTNYQVKLLSADNVMELYEFPVSSCESLLAQIREPEKYPFISMAREEILGWRFFHEFDTSSRSPLRQPQITHWSPRLHNDGTNLANALQSIRESSPKRSIEDCFSMAFPSMELDITPRENCLSIEVSQENMSRPLQASELSDGTLRFLCLLAALKSLHQPNLIVLNEPEMSLNPSIYPALIDLIRATAEQTQLIIVSHDSELQKQLSETCECKSLDLIMENGATKLATHAGANKVWEF